MNATTVSYTHLVHADYLPVLQELKAEIQAYLDWAQPQLDAGVPENQLTLFSTLNLHIFQTYYGGLRQSACLLYTSLEHSAVPANGPLLPLPNHTKSVYVPCSKCTAFFYYSCLYQGMQAFSAARLVF